MRASQSGDPRNAQCLLLRPSHARHCSHASRRNLPRRRRQLRHHIAPPTAGKWSRAYLRSGFVGPARIGGYLRSTLEPHGEWIREQVRARVVFRTALT